MGIYTSCLRQHADANAVAFDGIVWSRLVNDCSFLRLFYWDGCLGVWNEMCQNVAKENKG